MENEKKTNDNDDRNGSNENNQRPPKKYTPGLKKRKRLFIKYMMTTMVIIVSFFMVSFIVVFGYIVINGRNNSTREVIPNTGVVMAADEDEDPNKGFVDRVLDAVIVAPRKTNVLLLGLDQGGLLSDVILVVSFDSKTKMIDVISMPRDTYVSLTKNQISELNAVGKYPPSAMKLTEVHSYAGADIGYQYSTLKVQEILGIEIDYYAEIRLSAFREIIDAVDGIYMDIPDGGLYYDDPEQNLRIAVPGGRQLLTGTQAEGVVRFRNTYRRGDLERIDVQKVFMKEFFTQVLNKETIMNNLTDFFGTVLNYVRTDFGLEDIPQYLTSLGGLSADNIRFHTLPGVPRDIGGGSYYVYDQEATEKLVGNTFLNYEASASTGEAVPGAGKALRIQLLNGSHKSTISQDIREALSADGYQVTDAGDYLETKTNKTRIFVKQEQDGESLIHHFTNAEVAVAPERIPQAFDMVVVLGKSE